MRTTTETFLEQSRAYLFRTDWTRPAPPQPGNRPPTRASKDRRRRRSPRPG